MTGHVESDGDRELAAIGSFVERLLALWGEYPTLVEPLFVAVMQGMADGVADLACVCDCENCSGSRAYIADWVRGCLSATEAAPGVNTIQ